MGKRSIKIIVNADDFGISPGTNQAIAEGYSRGIINSTSLMVNTPYIDQAIRELKSLKNLSVGLHINMTNEKALSPMGKIPLLVDENGNFKNGFVKLLWLSLVKPKKFSQQAEIEIESQIRKTMDSGVKLSHLDSHRHIHMIPRIFSLVKKLSDKYNIPRIRYVNENIFYTILNSGDFSYLWNGSLIKYFILKFFSLVNSYKTDTYFYSILYTGRIFKDKVMNLNIPSEYSVLELGIHPNIKNIDGGKDVYIFDKDVLSTNRIREMEMAIDKSVLGTNRRFIFKEANHG